MKRLTVKIEHETKKAYLVIDEKGRKGWIQKRWLKNNAVTEKTMQKAANNYKERQTVKAEAQQWSNSYHVILSIAKETAKAIAVQANFDAYNLERDFTRYLWIPKSLLKNMAVPGWFIAKKVREVAAELEDEICTGVMCDYIAVENCERLM